MENNTLYDLMKNSDYSNAFNNYFFLLGCGKKRQANTFKKIMDKIEKDFASK